MFGLTGRGLSISTYLAVLALVTVLPLAVFSLYMTARLQAEEEARIQRNSHRAAEAIAQVVGRHLHDMTLTLRLLESSPELVSGELAEFHDRAQRALADHWFMILADREGQQLLNTRTPYGSSLGRTSNLEALARAQDSSSAIVTDAFLGRTSGEWVYNVMKKLEAPSPELAGGVLILTQNARDLSLLAPDTLLPPGWYYAILDRESQVVMSNAEAPAREALQVPDEERSGVVRAQSEVPSAPWRVEVWGPRDSVAASIAATSRSFFWAAIFSILLSLALAMLIGRRLQAAILEMSDRAEGVGKGQVVSPLSTPVREINLVSRALSDASFDRSQAEDQLQMTLREMAHRTKNILLIVQAMIRQTARSSSSTEHFVEVIGGRIMAFARSIDLLISAAQASVTLRALIDTQLAVFPEARTRITIVGEDFLLKDGVVKDLGIILHEFATNAAKYGALSTADGQVRLEWQLRRVEGRSEFHLVWEEHDGPAVTEPERTGFGSDLVRITIATMKGNAKCSYLPDGVRWEVTAPADSLVQAEPQPDPQGVAVAAG